ncbi:MAG: TonB-dependent receptor domain-containing protein, partial [Endozoicomonas sp.]
VKTVLMDGSMYLNASLFRTNYKDFQLQTVNPDNTRLSIIDTADAFTQGLDVDLTWLATEQLTVGYNMALAQAEYTEDTIAVDKGQRLLRAPKFSAALNLDFVQPIEAGDIRYNMTYSYSSTQRLTNQKLSEMQVEDSGLTLTKSDIYSGSFDNLNARITFSPRGQNWETALWATNILDKAYRADGHFELTNSTLAQSGSIARPYIRNAPRAVGLEFSYYFGEL